MALDRFADDAPDSHGVVRRAEQGIDVHGSPCGAVRAPSSHNTQPWLFRLGADRIELHADRSRALRVNDPDDRELVISCGAALFNLLISAAHHGWSAQPHVLPSGDPDHLATVVLAPTQGTSDDRLWHAIARRCTARPR